jgi:MFS family permease
MRLPFFYGWVIIAVTFVTMAIGVNARTAFSLFFPPIIDEFGWERGVTAGAFSFGFLVSAGMSPLIGRMMDRFGPRAVMELGVVLMAGGLLLAPLTTQPWHLYLTIGVLVGAGSICLGYSGQSLFLPNWFTRRRGLAMGLAFAGVGIGSITLLPWVQHMIEQTGWRTACTAMGLLVLLALAPINLLLRKRPEDIGLRPDGDEAPSASSADYMSGTRCRCTRPNIFSISASAPMSRSGPWARSACSAFPDRSCLDTSPIGSGANGSGPRAASVLRSAWWP